MARGSAHGPDFSEGDDDVASIREMDTIVRLDIAHTFKICENRPELFDFVRRGAGAVVRRLLQQVGVKTRQPDRFLPCAAACNRPGTSPNADSFHTDSYLS